jgi:hypothetical protein
MHYLACIMDYEIHYFGYPAVLDATSGYVFSLCNTQVDYPNEVYYESRTHGT